MMKMMRNDRILQTDICIYILLLSNQEGQPWMKMNKHPDRQGSEYADKIPCREVPSTINKKRESPENDTKLHLVVRLQFLNPEKCRVSLHWWYPLVHSDQEF